MVVCWTDPFFRKKNSDAVAVLKSLVYLLDLLLLHFEIDNLSKKHERNYFWWIVWSAVLAYLEHRGRPRRVPYVVVKSVKRVRPIKRCVSAVYLWLKALGFYGTWGCCDACIYAWVTCTEFQQSPTKTLAFFPPHFMHSCFHSPSVDLQFMKEADRSSEMIGLAIEAGESLLSVARMLWGPVFPHRWGVRFHSTP